MRRAPAVLFGVVLAIAVAVAELADQRMAGGPLQRSVPSNAITFSVTAGSRFTYGGLRVSNPGQEAVFLEGVRLNHASPGIRIDAAYVLPIPVTGAALWFNSARFPPPGISVRQLAPLTGFRLSPPDGGQLHEVQVLLALSIPAEGRYEFAAIDVDYRVAGQRYVATFPFAMRVCSPPVDQGRCPGLEATAEIGALFDRWVAERALSSDTLVGHDCPAAHQWLQPDDLPGAAGRRNHQADPPTGLGDLRHVPLLRDHRRHPAGGGCGPPHRLQR